MGRSVVEGEGEVELGSGALVVVEAVAEGLEEALCHEEEGLVVFDRGLEGVGDVVVVFGAVELEEAVVFAVGDVVELREFFAEAFGETLAGEIREIGEGLEAPELEDLGVWEGEGFREDEVGEFEGERGLVLRREGGEVGKIGGFAEADLERKSEVGGGGEGVGEPVFFGSDEEGGEIEEEGFGSGEFEVGDEGIDEGESFGVGGFFGSGIGIQKEEVGATGEAAGGAETGVDAELAGGEVGCDEVGLFTLAGGEEGGGLIRRSAVAGEEAAEREVAEMESGVVHAFPASFCCSVLWSCRTGDLSSR